MKIRLIRRFKGQDYTIGDLYVNGEWFCNTLEDTVREKKIKHITAIPEGTYDVVLTHSPKFKRVLPLIQNVPEFSGIRIHSGTDQNDTSGCVLVGENTEKGKLTNSKHTLAKLMSLLEGQENIKIEIV